MHVAILQAMSLSIIKRALPVISIAAGHCHIASMLPGSMSFGIPAVQMILLVLIIRSRCPFISWYVVRSANLLTCVGVSAFFMETSACPAETSILIRIKIYLCLQKNLHGQVPFIIRVEFIDRIVVLQVPKRSHQITSTYSIEE